MRFAYSFAHATFQVKLCAQKKTFDFFIVNDGLIVHAVVQAKARASRFVYARRYMTVFHAFGLTLFYVERVGVD